MAGSLWSGSTVLDDASALRHDPFFCSTVLEDASRRRVDSFFCFLYLGSIARRRREILDRAGSPQERGDDGSRLDAIDHEIEVVLHGERAAELRAALGELAEVVDLVSSWGETPPRSTRRSARPAARLDSPGPGRVTPICARTTGEIRWLLEVFDCCPRLAGRPVERHAVWLSQYEDRSCWHCCCGAGGLVPGEATALAEMLTLARDHFSDLREWFPAPVWHPIAAWNHRALGRSIDAQDIVDLAWQISSTKT